MSTATKTLVFEFQAKVTELTKGLEQIQSKLDKTIDNATELSNKLKNNLADASQKVKANMDKLSNSLNTVGAKMKSVGSTMTNKLTKPILGVTAAAAAGAAGLVAWSTSLGMQLEATEAKFSTVFGEFSDEMDAFGKELKQLSPMTQAEFRSMASGIQDILVPMGHTRENATEMTQDFMHLSGALQAFNSDTKSMEDVTSALTSALTGELTALKSLGINLSSEQVKLKAVEMGLAATTSEVDQQAFSLAVLELAYASSSDALAAFTKENMDTKGKIAVAWSNLQDVLADFGTRLLPLFDPFLDFFNNELTPSIQEFLDKFDEAEIGKIKDAISKIVDKWGQKLVKWLEDVEPSDIVDGLISVAESIDQIATALSKIPAEVWVGLAVAGPVLEGLGNLFLIGGGVAKLFGSGGAIATAISWIGSAFSWLGGVIASAASWIGSLFAGVSSSTLATIAAIVAVPLAIAAMFAGAKQECENWLQYFWRGVGVFGERVLEWVDWLTNFVIDGAKALAEGLMNTLSRLNEWIIGLAQGFKDWLTGLITTVVEWLLGKIESMKNGLSEKIQLLVENIKGFFTDLKDKSKEIWENIKSTLLGFGQDIWDGLVRSFSNMKEGVLGIWDGIGNGIRGVVNNIIGFVNKMIGGLNSMRIDIPAILGGGTIGFNIPKIPELATGGLLEQGSAIVGEAGPELLTKAGNSVKVQPLSAREKADGIGGSLGAQPVQIVINNPVVRDDKDIQTLSEKLAEVLKQQDFGFGL